MPAKTNRVVLKVNNEFYSIFIDNEEAYTAWKDSEDQPISEMIVFTGDNIFKGKKRAPSKDQASDQDLENAFIDLLPDYEGDASSKEFLDEVKRYILLKGELAHDEGMDSTWTSRNDARGGKIHDTRGSGSRTTGA
ncbi:hypothetical protein SCHPADRAFT_938374 [Schizopora paradoxa]|uniref:Ribosome maturation protein SDO1/SBDS N-terminal domain-containing protein n=1 Tax=Schizopora paradoxa TaxID=27342 RepID=A0A0H2RV95_9AGAM|nr:hypothetical protein SCHPADRAFT_938374 [Schizopora paradoxa]